LKTAATDSTQSSDYDVLTPERVMLRYDVAGIGSRSAAATVDIAIQFVAFAALIVGLLGSAALGAVTEPLSPAALGNGTIPQSTIVLALVVAGMFAILWGYYIFFEIVWNGQTPGKRLLGLRVIRENGYPLRAADALIRNLIRIVDGPPFSAIVGLFIMLLNERSRRLGDYAAGTVVIREAKNHARWGDVVAPGQQTSHVVSLRPRDASLVRDFLARRHLLASPPRAALAARLAETFATRYGLVQQRLAQSDEAFLESLGSGS
jgi:uncharacterized RDD family membrane protein YckC